MGRTQVFLDENASYLNNNYCLMKNDTIGLAARQLFSMHRSFLRCLPVEHFANNCDSFLLRKPYNDIQ